MAERREDSIEGAILSAGTNVSRSFYASEIDLVILIPLASSS